MLVELRARPEALREFVDGLLANARASLSDEPGCLRFDVHQDLEDPHLFRLHEIYRDRAAFEVEHRTAAHYGLWREVVARTVVPGSHRNTYARPLSDPSEAE